jgi:hypothetical protein
VVVGFFAAIAGDCWASRSITALQPELKLARFLIVQAVIKGMSGISELQNRSASLAHICCASGLNAWPDVEENEMANAAINAPSRNDLVMT